MRIGTTELLLLLALALLIFGGSKLSGLGKALGTSIREFKKETSSVTETETSSAPEAETTSVSEAQTTGTEAKKEENKNVSS